MCLSAAQNNYRDPSYGWGVLGCMSLPLLKGLKWKPTSALLVAYTGLSLEVYSSQSSVL